MGFTDVNAIRLAMLSALLFLSTQGNAQPPQPLPELVLQLQQPPQDDGLHRKIIRRALMLFGADYGALRFTRIADRDFAAGYNSACVHYLCCRCVPHWPIQRWQRCRQYVR